MRNTLLILFFLLTTLTLNAEVITGIVLDESGEPVPYASVFQRSNPIAGTSTDAEGRFSLTLDRSKNDTLIVSFISYKTLEYPLSKITKNASVTFTLHEQPIMLDEATVKVKLSRRQAKEMKKNVLSQFKNRLVKDFPKQRNDFNIVSSYSGSQNGRTLMQHEVVGIMHEYPKQRGNYGDSLRLEVLSIRKDYTAEVQNAYQKLDSISVQRFNTKKAKRKGLHYNSRTLDHRAEGMHRFLWGGQSCFIVDRVDFDHTNRWQYTEVGGNTVLIYTYSQNYLIAKATMKVYFYVDPSTFALLKMSQCFTFEGHIPFGYKLKADELAFFNALQLPDQTIKKIRIHDIYGDIKRNVIFNPASSPNRRVKEKNLNVDVKIVGTKKETALYKAKAKAVVTK